MSSIGGCSTCHTSTGVAALSRALYEQKDKTTDKVGEQSSPDAKVQPKASPTLEAAGQIINDYA